MREWFKTQVVARSMNATLWTLFFQIFVVCITLVIFNALSWNVMQGFRDVMWSCIGYPELFFQLLLALVTSFISIIQLNQLSAIPKIWKSRLDVIVNFCKPKNIFNIIVCGVGGGVIVRCYLALISKKHKNLSQICFYDPDSICLDEKHFFVVFNGMFAGMLYYISCFLQDSYYLEINPFQQPKLLVSKSEIYNVIVEGAIRTLQEMKYFYVLYFVFGKNFRDNICNVLNLSYGEEYKLTTFKGLVDIDLFLTVFITGIILHIVWAYNKYLLKIFLAERIVFPLEETFEVEKDRCLHHSLACNDIPLLQSLGYLDLCHLAKYSFKRRQQIFSVSQPGGHPHQWNQISCTVLARIETLMKQLSTVSSVPPKTESQKLNEVPQTDLSYIKCMENFLTCKFKKIIDFWNKISPISAIYSEYPEAQMHKYFLTCQPVIWGIEALSFLVCASYDEDRYGVVQKSLSKIISLMLDLQTTLERFQKSLSVARKPGPLSRDIQLRQSLRIVLNGALYRIALTFKKHLSDIAFQEDHRQQLYEFSQLKK
ncbi:nuclear division cycle 1 [Tachypleus tridentatus]|uniref:nuclear division cycle 1 n=1 Tax=Tachypleus tridentatus TaxID=6853 RepID=UPI003FD28F29